MTSYRIKITRDGRLHFIYHDLLQPLFTLGHTHITRASHVEPTSSNTWMADLGPTQGPILGPFQTRSEAITAEHDWLIENWLRTTYT